MPPPASCWEIRAARNTVSCEVLEPCRQFLGAAAVVQAHRAVRGQASDARDGKAAGQPDRVLQARAHSGRYRKQELVVFPSPKRVEERRSLLDGQSIGVYDGAKAAGLPELTNAVGQSVTQIHARA